MGIGCAVAIAKGDGWAYLTVLGKEVREAGVNTHTGEPGVRETSEDYSGVYLVSPRMLTVYIGAFQLPLVLLESYLLDGAEPNWSTVECGERLERCYHSPPCRRIWNCPECGGPSDDRVLAGMKCGACAYGK